MAKLTDLTSLTNIAGNDEFYVVDVSDTSESAQGTSKKITRDQFSLGINHSSLASLLIDSHTQYALLSGRGTGQTLNGGSNASGSLILDSTSNATKGNIILNPSGGAVGVKVTPADWRTTYTPIQAGRTVLFDTGTGGGYGWNFYNDTGGNNRYLGSGEQGVIGFEGGSFVVYSGLSGASGAPADVALVLSLKKDTTLALQGAVRTSGIGISFPSTQSASTNANTLDDYEEGNFTPTLASGFSTAPTSYSTQNGSYTKIGRLVYFQIELVPNGAVANATHLTIGGLPFSSVNSSAVGYGFGVVNYQLGFNTNAGDTYHITANVTTIGVYDNAGNIRLGNAGGVNINSRIILNGCYITAT